MKLERSCGVILPVYSLPSKYGIGTFGREAYKFIDFLKKSGQSYWQVLPLGPTSFGDSPYQSFSAFAGNPYFIDLDLLKADGLLTAKEITSFDYGENDREVDYPRLYESRFAVLKIAAARGLSAYNQDFENFKNENHEWLPDYSLFMALKAHFSMRAWTEWDDDGARLRNPDSLAYYREALKDDISFYEYLQFLFFKQWNELLTYAHAQGVGIIGDLPIYVSMDSADVWANRDCFMLDEQGNATDVAGVPPDYFSKDGQLWGNPLYNWENMKRDGYCWWIRRIAGATKLYDVIRIDHFRGFESFYAIPASAKNAKKGRWLKGPGMDFVGVMTSWFSDTQFIAEDLGILTEEVRQLRRDSGLPGMKVLEFAFSSRELSDYLPSRYEENCICYTGTHDNMPLGAWHEEAPKEDIKFAFEYLGLDAGAANMLCEPIIRAGLASVAKLFVAQMQDYLQTDAQSRTNEPGTMGKNWKWRLAKDDLTPALAKHMKRMAYIYGR